MGQDIILSSHHTLKFQYRKFLREFKKKESVNKHRVSGTWENQAENPTSVYMVATGGI